MNHTTLQSWLTTYDAACDIIESHWAFRSKITEAFFEKCEEARNLRRELGRSVAELNQQRKRTDYYRKEMIRFKYEQKE
jgi:hypothetical protein